MLSSLLSSSPTSLLPSFLSSRSFSFSSFSSVVHWRRRRRRRQITIYYKYCSHGVFYVLLLLIYSYFLIQSPAIALADTERSQIKAGENDEYIKTSNEVDHAVSAIKLDEHFEDESFDEHGDDTEYKDLLSNKSGKFFRYFVHILYISVYIHIVFTRSVSFCFVFKSF